MEKRKLLTVVYGMDNENQIYQLESSLKSLIETNGTKYNVLVLVSDELLKKKILTLFVKLNLNENFKSEIISDLSSMKKCGMFYWLLSPYIVESEYILQLDNDTILNTDLKNVVNSVANSKFGIWGVAINFSFKNKAVRTIEKFFTFEVNKKNMRKWINAGVVLIKNDIYKSVIKTKDEMIEKLLKYSNSNQNENVDFFSISDEAFLILNFWNIMGKLNRKYNLRVHSRNTTRRNIKTNDYIFHYNLKLKIDGKLQKLDFQKLMIDKNYSEKVAIEMSKEVKEQKNKYGEIVVSNLRKNHKSSFIKKDNYVQ